VRERWSFSRSGTFLGYKQVKRSHETTKKVVIIILLIITLIGIGVEIGSLNFTTGPNPELFK